MESCVVVGGAGIPSGNSQKLGTLLHTFPKNVGFYELNCKFRPLNSGSQPLAVQSQ